MESEHKADLERARNESKTSKKKERELQAKLDAINAAAAQKEKILHKRRKDEKTRLEKMGMNHESHFNFAFTGPTGCGKSSTINALRGVRAKHPTYAPVGTGKEETKKIARYPFSEILNYVVFWDIPGGGTAQHPGDSYFSDKCLDLFDSIFLLYDQRWVELNDHIIRKAQEYGVLDRVAIVYAKTGDSIRNYGREKELGRVDAYENLRTDVTANVRAATSRIVGDAASQNIPIFFICGYTLQDGSAEYEEMQLMEFMIHAAAKRFPAGEFGQDARQAVVQRFTGVGFGQDARQAASTSSPAGEFGQDGKKVHDVYELEHYVHHPTTYSSLRSI